LSTIPPISKSPPTLAHLTHKKKTMTYYVGNAGPRFGTSIQIFRR